MVADWNLNLHRVWVRAYLRATFPAFRAPQKRPAGGTHGARLIDFPIGLRIVGLTMRVLREESDVLDASDHLPIRIRGTIRKRRR